MLEKEVVEDFQRGNVNLPIRISSCRKLSFDFNKYYRNRRDKIIKLDGFPTEENFSGDMIFSLYEIGEKRPKSFSPLDLVIPSRVIEEVGYLRGSQVLNLTIFLDVSNIDPFVDFYVAYGRHRQVSKKERREMAIRFKKMFGLGEGFILGGDGLYSGES